MVEGSVKSLTRDSVSYYREVVGVMTASFAGVPLVWGSYPKSDGMIAWHSQLHASHYVSPTIDVETSNGAVHPYFRLEPPILKWIVEHFPNVEFHSWTPIPSDPLYVRYARIVLENRSGLDGGPPHSVRNAALKLRELLDEYKTASIPLLGGRGGVTLYIPLSDAPEYPEVRAWLHYLVNDAAARFPRTFTTEAHATGDGRIHLHVGSNAPGRFSVLPYSLHGPEGRFAAAPVTWDELASRHEDKLRIEASGLLERLGRDGDLFAKLSAEIGTQRFSDVAHAKVLKMAMAPLQGHGHVIAAAMAILEDGVARSADQILAEALQRKLLPASTSEKYVYNALVTLKDRNVARGRKPPIVQDPDRKFRINEPLDDWPSVDLPKAAPDEAGAALLDRLRKIVGAGDSVAWEAAVCDAFAHLGFRTTHLGGNKAPDGYADAQLGPLGYRVMLECKSGSGMVTDPDAAEAAKWTDAYHAQYSALIGPGFSQEVELISELQTHKVSAWSVDDLATAIQEQLNPFELQDCFAPGFAGDVIADVLWERQHGLRKRTLYLAETIQRLGWEAQVAAATQAQPADAAHLTLDAAMVLVQEELSRQGSRRACTRDEVRLAFEQLTNPIVGLAVWLDVGCNAIVLMAQR